jgi:transcriptional/translational regulatory protein YebC/TACO1
MIYLNLNSKKLEDIEEILMESGADDYTMEDENELLVVTQKQDLV